MDHLRSVASQHLDSAQVKLQTVSTNFAESLTRFSNNVRLSYLDQLSMIRDHRLGHTILEVISRWQAQLRTAWVGFSYRELYDRGIYWFVTEVTRTHLYLGGMCFIFGGIIGIAFGLKIERCVVAPQKMRAVVATHYNGLESITVVEDMIVPRIIDQHQVLVQVKAAGIDYLDIRISEGYGRNLRSHLNKYNSNFTSDLPVVLGRDCSGVVTAVGRAVTRVEQGDEVWLAVPFHHPGTLSEYIVVSEELVAPKPLQLSHEGAAALPFSAMTAWHALVNQAGLGPMNTSGKRVLIHAGVSGVGVVGVQLVHAWGGHVTATVASSAAPLVHLLGTDDVIVYDDCDVEKELLLREKYDVVLNTISPAFHNSCLQHCTPGGCVVTTAMSPLASDTYGCTFGTLFALWSRVKYFFVKAPWLTGGGLGMIEMSGHILDHLSPLIECGQLQAVVDKAYCIQDVEAAFAHVARGGGQIGRTVIRFRSRPLAARIDGGC